MDLTSAILKKAEAFIDANDLLRDVARLGLAVSGGSDSMTLLHIIPMICGKRGIKTIVLCFDHAIAGENSAAEAEFVRQAAIAAELQYDIERADPPVEPVAGLSMEMAARNARRDFFLRMAAKHNLDAIATGHQQNDVAETLMLRLFRGAGATGLSGLRPKSPAQKNVAPGIIRPLLPFGREELRNYLQSQSIPWMDDVSNANQKIQRNRIRLKLLPTLAQAFNIEETTLTSAIAQTATILRDEDNYLDTLAIEWLSKTDLSILPIDAVRNEPKALARRIVHQWLLKNAPKEAAGFQVVEEILNKGKSSINLPENLALRIRNGALRLERQGCDEVKAPEEIELHMGINRWGDYTITVSESAEIVRERSHLGSWPAKCTIPKALLNGKRLFVRVRKDGDSITPFGIKGSQKLQDIFVNEKLPKEERGLYPVVLCDSDIVWLPGYRINADYAAKETTELILIEISR